MKIAILGTGNMGAGFAEALAAKHDVIIGGRDLVKASAIAEKTGHGVIGGGIAAAVKMADVVLLALPFSAVEEALNEVGTMQGKVLIDITNPVTEDFSGLSIGHTTSAAEAIQALAPSAKVVKAFNTIFAQLLPENPRTSQKLQTFVAGDDELAKKAVVDIASSVGFEPVDAGPLKNARFLEPLGAMNIQFGYFLGQGATVAPAWVHI